MMKDNPDRPLIFSVNGKPVRLTIAADTPLLLALRNDLQLNGPKYGCGLGECGACTVLLDGKVARSCMLPAQVAVGREVTTLEGLGSLDHLHPVQQAFIEEQAAQCGYCLNGMVMTTAALLQRIPHPSEQQVRKALAHNLCRCGTHVEIIRAVMRAAELLSTTDTLAPVEPHTTATDAPSSTAVTEGQPA